MADTILKSITLRNWTTVRESTLEFPAQGLVLLRGINSVARGKMDSIGAGKTCLGEAISRTLFGVKGRYTQLGHYSTQGKGNSYVAVNCLHKGKPLKVEMGFKCQELSTTGEGLKITYQDQEIQRDHIDRTRDELAQILTVPTDLAGWTVHLDGDRLKFDDLSESKSVELLMAALMQPRWNAYQKTTSDKANTLKSQLNHDRLAVEQAKETVATTETELQYAKANQDEAQNVYNTELKLTKVKLKELEDTIAEVTAAIAKRQKRMAVVKQEIDHRIALTAKKEKELEIIVNEKQEAKDVLNEELSALRSKEAAARRDLDYAQRHLDQAKKTPNACPTCGTAWDRAKTALQEHTDEVQAKQGLLDKAAKLTQTKLRGVAQSQDAWLAAKTALDAARAEAPIEELSEEYEELESGLEPERDNLSEAQQERIRVEQGPDKTEITRFETQVKEREQQLIKNKRAVEKIAAKVVESEELLRVVEYWQEAFGASGIPNMILGDALGPLNAMSRRVSTLMSGGMLEVSYSTTKQLKTGTDKAALTINVRNELGSHRADGSSKGEGGLNNLIIAETLAEVGGIAHRIGYRWYDEILANQDEVVRRSVLSYLKDLATRYGILVFVVAHSPEATNYADYALIAEKTAQGTTYRWE